MSSFSRVLKAMAIVVLCLAAIIRAVPVADSDAYALVHALSIVDDGVVHLGHDGVLRSYHGNGSVCDYAKLHPHQIQQLVTGHDHTEGLIAIFKGVDGHDVKDEAQLLKQAEFVVLSKERRSEEGTETEEAVGPYVINPGIIDSCNRVPCDTHYHCQQRWHTPGRHCGPCLRYPGDNPRLSGRCT